MRGIHKVVVVALFCAFPTLARGQGSFQAGNYTFTLTAFTCPGLVGGFFLPPPSSCGPPQVSQSIFLVLTFTNRSATTVTDVFYGLFPPFDQGFVDGFFSGGCVKLQPGATVSEGVSLVVGGERRLNSSYATCFFNEV